MKKRKKAQTGKKREEKNEGKEERKNYFYNPVSASFTII